MFRLFGRINRLCLSHFKQDVGANEGENYALNFPLHDGMDDDSFKSIFRPVSKIILECILLILLKVIGKIMEVFQPGAVVLQCGADSLSGDRLGCFNLSLKGLISDDTLRTFLPTN